MNFIQADNKLVNIETVSSINFLNNRVAFDFNAPVELDSGKIISYYAYADFNSDSERKEYIEKLLQNSYIDENFIDTNTGLINLKQVTAIKFEESSQGYRVIFNLSHSVTSVGFNNQPRLTSKFIYVDFKNKDAFEDYKQNLTQKLGA